MSVSRETRLTAGDVLAALRDVPSRARDLAARRAAIERQNDSVDDLRQRALRVSRSGQVFDLGHTLLWVRNGPTPRGSSLLYLMALQPISQEDVDDFHGGWA